jgi:predicted DNA-binding protein (MmcQ/YjbR family)
VQTRQEAIAFCLTLGNTYEDYPFRDPNWTVMRHRANRKVFAWIFERNGQIWINLKGGEGFLELWRQMYSSVLPAYHLNKAHWNSVILDGTVPEEEIQEMIGQSYALTKKK